MTGRYVRDEDGGIVKARCGTCEAWYGPEMFHKGGKPGTLYAHCKPCVSERKRSTGADWSKIDAMPLPDWDTLLGYHWGTEVTTYKKVERS